jgi:hypothetical protein
MSQQVISMGHLPAKVAAGLAPILDLDGQKLSVVIVSTAAERYQEATQHQHQHQQFHVQVQFRQSKECLHLEAHWKKAVAAAEERSSQTSGTFLCQNFDKVLQLVRYVQVNSICNQT